MARSYSRGEVLEEVKFMSLSELFGIKSSSQSGGRAHLPKRVSANGEKEGNCYAAYYPMPRSVTEWNLANVLA